MKVFYGVNRILVQDDDGSKPRLFSRQVIAVYFQIPPEKIKDKHLKKFINNQI